MKTGLIINNIGTPDAPTPKAVGHYLREFLMDKDIINIPYIFRFVLVNIGIVPRRRYQSALKYKRIWGQKKSPLMEYTESFSEQLQADLGPDFIVEIGMRYGNPNLQKAIENLVAQNVDQIIFVPMYPQYARATVGSAVDQFKDLIKKYPGMKFKILSPFFRHKTYIENKARLLKQEIEKGQFEHIVFSFHGLPESQMLKNKGCSLSEKCCASENQILSGCYRAQCFDTARKIAEQADLPTQHYSVSFQSRLGPKRWIRPYTTDTVLDLQKQGIKNVLVQTPSFVVDCLETLEEIALELKEDFVHQGGSDLKLVPCLNDDKKWIKDFSDLISREAHL